MATLSEVSPSKVREKRVKVPKKCFLPHPELQTLVLATKNIVWGPEKVGFLPRAGRTCLAAPGRCAALRSLARFKTPLFFVVFLLSLPAVIYIFGAGG